MSFTILGTFPSMNGQFKITARRGAQVVHIDRLTAEQAAATTPADVEAFWNERTVRPAPRKSTVSA